MTSESKLRFASAIAWMTTALFFSAWWARCRQPRLTQLTDGSEGYAVFRVGT